MGIFNLLRHTFVDTNTAVFIFLIFRQFFLIFFVYELASDSIHSAAA